MVRTLLVAGVVLLAASARADVVQPEPPSCPLGSDPHTCHGGPHCRPSACSAAGECPAGKWCTTRQLCIEKLDCGGMGGSYFVDAVRGECAATAPCKAGTCQPVAVCAPGPASDRERPWSDRGSRRDAPASGDGVTTPGRGCTCALDGPAAAAPPALLLGAALLLALRRRRRS
jgi:MYXO-CTERM domain-containing protein